MSASNGAAGGFAADMGLDGSSPTMKRGRTEEQQLRFDPRSGKTVRFEGERPSGTAAHAGPQRDALAAEQPGVRPLLARGRRRAMGLVHRPEQKVEGGRAEERPGNAGVPSTARLAALARQGARGAAKAAGGAAAAAHARAVGAWIRPLEQLAAGPRSARRCGRVTFIFFHHNVGGPSASGSCLCSVGSWVAEAAATSTTLPMLNATGAQLGRGRRPARRPPRPLPQRRHRACTRFCMQRADADARHAMPPAASSSSAANNNNAAGLQLSGEATLPFGLGRFTFGGRVALPPSLGGPPHSAPPPPPTTRRVSLAFLLPRRPRRPLESISWPLEMVLANLMEDATPTAEELASAGLRSRSRSPRPASEAGASGRPRWLGSGVGRRRWLGGGDDGG